MKSTYLDDGFITSRFLILLMHKIEVILDDLDVNQKLHQNAWNFFSQVSQIFRMMMMMMKMMRITENIMSRYLFLILLDMFEKFPCSNEF